MMAPQAGRRRRLRWALAGALLVLALGVGLWFKRFHRYTPVEAALDLKAAVASRNAPQPVGRFLELRYGPLSEAGNRQRAFLDFFNVGHIEGLRLVVGRIPPRQREHAIHGMARWIADYRQTLSPEEKESLRTHLRSEIGRRQVQEATAKYLGQDVYYRATTAPVIAELMATLAALQTP